MKVTISVGGRFHAFSLAYQLLKRGYLERLITSYPKFEVRKYGIPRNHTKSLIVKELFWRFWSGLSSTMQNIFDAQFFINNLYDSLASRLVGKADIFVGWSSFSLRSLRKARSSGAMIIIEHGSSHPEYQKKILEEEYVLLNLKANPISLKCTNKMLNEFSEADYISIPSLFVKRTFIEQGIPESKLIHVPYGVDLSAFHQIKKEDDKFRVVFAGGMSLRKGVHYLLRAFAELNLPNSELMLLGSTNEEMKPFFKKYEGHFNHVGKVPQRELYKYYSQGSVFCMMSIEEGLAMVQPQAMACGLPVICTTNTGGEDIIRDGQDGFVIPIRDVEKLKEKLLYLYNNPNILSQMSASAKERVSKGFTWDDYGDKIVAEYERILKERKNA